MKRLRRLRAVVVSFTIALFPASVDAGWITFDVSGSSTTVPVGINNAGQVSGAYVDPDGLFRGFVRDADGAITTFDVSGSFETLGGGINNAGQVAGFYSDATGTHGFVRDAGGAFSAFDVPGSIATQAQGLNDAGQVTGFYIDATFHAHGFLRDATG